jgi:hypothetical protein
LTGASSKSPTIPRWSDGDDRFDSAEKVFGHDYDREGDVPNEFKASAVAVFIGYVLHRSLANRAKAGFRRALVTHSICAESLLAWSMGAPTARADVRDIVMIAGEDP